ncbi:streptomycin 3-adenylyltransferase [Kytococcus aerolatus]|uniref:Streptomycin 3-adenylyltransferase n=1 Tax=Kytococcus aerolatus TaxID=592308 RepID=A0A212T821_9MICO|nr:nucleotidyltransferase domain-containing protein [Kytococcus aerolatus]SNC62203.1 streptomycin 3-adenylyltransferase [Kytococcus aerolatus]
MHRAAQWGPLAEQVADICVAHLRTLVGAYVQGSAVLGGFTGASDLDVLVIVADSTGLEDFGTALSRMTSLDRPVELSVVTAAAAATPASPWPYLLHVNTDTEDVVHDDGSGDPDLLAHYAVTRAHGHTLVGPEPDRVIGETPHHDLVDYLAGELSWALDHADQRYAVLNACRAVAFAESGELLSKVEGARWWALHRGWSPLVEGCLEAQLDGRDMGSPSPAARSFVAACIDELRV